MAYYTKALKAMAAGSAKAPGVFTYHTDDSIAEITTEGYFDKANFVMPNDIIYATPLNGGILSKIICVKSDQSEPIGSQTNFSVFASFAGDVRATDEAGYQSDNFGVGLGSAQGVFMQHTYRNNTDTQALIATADYFVEAGKFLSVGDVIECVSVDKAFMLMVTAADATTVVTREIVFL